MLGAIYTRYLKTLAAIGGIGVSEYENETAKHGNNHQESLRLDAVSADAKGGYDGSATRLGNLYRGMGVVVGLLGAAIVFSALLPVGFHLEEETTLAIGVIEVVLMLAMALIVLGGIRYGIRDRWVIARREAEKQRYSVLYSELTQESADGVRIRELLEPVIKGQVDYNKSKMKQYESIEIFSDRLSWLGFFLALTAAIAHFFLHAPWLIFFTAFGPALVGAIHGINGFLRIGDLAEDHGKMYQRLKELLEKLEVTSTSNLDEIRKIGAAAYDLLSDRDAHWEAMARKLGLKMA